MHQSQRFCLFFPSFSLLYPSGGSHRHKVSQPNSTRFVATPYPPPTSIISPLFPTPLSSPSTYLFFFQPLPSRRISSRLLALARARTFPFRSIRAHPAFILKTLWLVEIVDWTTNRWKFWIKTRFVGHRNSDLFMVYDSLLGIESKDTNFKTRRSNFWSLTYVKFMHVVEIRMNWQLFILGLLSII